MRRVSFGTIVLLGATLLGCGGKGPDSSGPMIPPPPSPLPVFKCSDSPPQPDQIVMRCGVRLKPDTWQIDVVIGAHAASDIGGFAFELLIDQTILRYVSGSAQSGSLLFQGGYDPLISVGPAPGDPGRLVVGIYRTGGAPGVAVVPGMFDRVMSFRVQVLPATQFIPVRDHLLFDTTRSVAIDSTDSQNTIPSITFGNELLLSFQ